jgi:hypothetical protein
MDLEVWKYDEGDLAKNVKKEVMSETTKSTERGENRGGKVLLYTFLWLASIRVHLDQAVDLENCPKSGVFFLGSGEGGGPIPTATIATTHVDIPMVNIPIPIFEPRPNATPTSTSSSFRRTPFGFPVDTVTVLPWG